MAAARQQRCHQRGWSKHRQPGRRCRSQHQQRRRHHQRRRRQRRQPVRQHDHRRHDQHHRHRRAAGRSPAPANFLSGVTLNGRMDMASIVNSRQRVTNGTDARAARIDINNNGILSFEGNSTLAGTGTIVLRQHGGASNRIALDGNGTTTFAAGTTVRGENGTIGGRAQHRRHADAGQQRHHQRRRGGRHHHDQHLAGASTTARSAP